MNEWIMNYEGNYIIPVFTGGLGDRAIVSDLNGFGFGINANIIGWNPICTPHCICDRHFHLYYYY